MKVKGFLTDALIIIEQAGSHRPNGKCHSGRHQRSDKHHDQVRYSLIQISNEYPWYLQHPENRYSHKVNQELNQENAEQRAFCQELAALERLACRHILQYTCGNREGVLAGNTQ